MRVSTWLLAYCTHNGNRLSHFFLLFLSYYLERVDLFCIFVPTVETNSPHNPSPSLTAPTAPHSLSPPLPRREGEKTPEKRSNPKVHKAQTTTPCTRQSTCRGVPLCAPVPINVRSILRAHTEVRPYNLNRGASLCARLFEQYRVLRKRQSRATRRK